MKLLILLVVLLALLLMFVENEHTTIQVVIIIPIELVPYYEWLLSYPGWQTPQDEPSREQPINIGYKSVTQQNEVITRASSHRNQQTVR